jgi:hypothetical protein
MDHLRTRLEALEHRTLTVERQLRWWRGLACGLTVAGLLGWGLPLGLAREDVPDKAKGEKGLAQRVAALEQLLKHFSREKNEIFITGANLHIVNGLGRTDCGTEEQPIADCPNGLGNLIVGYNEPRPEEFGENIRSGSHNVVVGQQHNFSRFGGLVVGNFNTISGDFAVVSGGEGNTASGVEASVSGGRENTASGIWSSVSGGRVNLPTDEFASVSGGFANVASGSHSSVSGGAENNASVFATVVSGGQGNRASGTFSSVCGGEANTTNSDFTVVSGGRANTAGGFWASVSGGEANTTNSDFAMVNGGSGNLASGRWASVSGGRNITQDTEFGWSAGSEGDEVVVGNFRSP